MVHPTRIRVYMYVYTDIYNGVYTGIPNSCTPPRSREILDVVFHETTSMVHS